LRLAQTLSRSVLYLLARPSTPDEARQEAIARAEAGGSASAADGLAEALDLRPHEPQRSRTEVGQRQELGVGFGGDFADGPKASVDKQATDTRRQAGLIDCNAAGPFQS
jgi:hypothetical protein